MRQIKITGKRQCEIAEVPDPTAVEDLVVVKIHVAPMCTEYKHYCEGEGFEGLGHEAAGEVVETARPGRVEVGDRVVVMPTYPCGKCPHCLGGDYIHCQNQRDIAALAGRPGGLSTYAEYVLKPDWLLVPIPDGISYEHAAMACCGLGPTFGAAERMEVGAFHTLLISGAGPVGLGGVINGAYRGARVIVAEPNEYRRELAADLGTEMTVDPTRQDAPDRIRDFAGGGGVDRALDCSGVPEAQRLALDSLRERGHFAFVGEGGDLTINTSLDMLRKGLTLHGVWHYNLSRTPQMMELIADCGDKLDRLITHRFDLENVEEAWQLQLTGRCGKVLLTP